MTNWECVLVGFTLGTFLGFPMFYIFAVGFLAIMERIKQ